MFFKSSVNIGVLTLCLLQRIYSIFPVKRFQEVINFFEIGGIAYNVSL